jgi:heat shock protein HslJ
MRRTLTAAFAASLLVLATSAGSSAQSPAPAASPLEGTSWTLTSYLSSGTVIPVAEGYVVDASFGADHVAGFSGCNQYVAPVTVSGTSITVGAIATTGRMCKMTIPNEQDYLAALAMAASFTQTADTLTIADASGATILEYAAAAAEPLTGAWIVTGYNNGAQAVVSPIEGTVLTAEFGPDGVTGNAGCNSYTGPASYDGTTLTVGPVASTMMACGDAVDAQEQQFLTALQTPSTVEVSGDTVTLRAANGEIQVTLARP